MQIAKIVQIIEYWSVEFGCLNFVQLLHNFGRYLKASGQFYQVLFRSHYSNYASNNIVEISEA